MSPCFAVCASRWEVVREIVGHAATTNDTLLDCSAVSIAQSVSLSLGGSTNSECVSIEVERYMSP